MIRAAVYARFSTELQSDRSIEDQITLCREYADRSGYQVVATYEDRAKSGGSVHGRDGLQRLMSDAMNRKFEVLIVENLDRLSRSMHDLSGIYDRLVFIGVRILAVHEGEVNTVLVGLRGLVGQMFREDNAHKVRRGLAGRVKDGLSAGGKAYGYRPNPLKKGEIIIDDAEAAVIRRIFQEYSEGRSPRAIVHGLNADAVPAPRARFWTASALHGNVTRGYGIIRNPIYNGQLVWNRIRMIKDPDTGRRVSRPNPPQEWQLSYREDLRIVDADLFEAVQERAKASFIPKPMHEARRPVRPLSGLLRCGSCGGGMSVYGTDRSKRFRIRCSTHKAAGTCSNPATYYVDEIEHAVFSLLRKEMKHPQVLKAYVKEYVEETKRLERERLKEKHILEDRLVQVIKEGTRYAELFAKGIGSDDFNLQKASELSQEKKIIESKLSAMPQDTNVVTFMPAALSYYDKQIDQLSSAIGGTVSDGDLCAAEAIRQIVDAVVITPGATGSPYKYTLDIKGDMARVLGFEQQTGVMSIVGSEGAIPTIGTQENRDLMGTRLRWNTPTVASARVPYVIKSVRQR